VDVLDWNAIPDNFKENIKKNYEMIQRGIENKETKSI
jgi:hypothetical protein